VADSGTQRRRRSGNIIREQVNIEALPSAPQRVSVVAVGPDIRPKPIGRADPEADAVHFVQVGRSLVLAGTIEDLRAFVVDMGMTVADMERDMIEELVEEGRRRVQRETRRLA
jgi:hypothetical protein